MTHLERPYLLPAGQTRVERAMMPFKLLAADSNGALSVCEFVLPGWSSGPPLHLHNDVDEAFFVVAGCLEFQLDDERRSAGAGDFAWVPRGTVHSFACASDDPVHVLSIACPGGIEHLFAEQHAYLESVDGPFDREVLDEMALRHGAQTVGPPITSPHAPVHGVEDH